MTTPSAGRLATLERRMIQKRTVTIDYSADAFAGLAGGVKTFTKALGDALPANARFVGFTAGEGTPTLFDDAAHGTYSLKVGGADDDEIATAVNVAAGQTGFPKAGSAGIAAFPGCPLAAEVKNAILTSSVDLNTVTQGSITLVLFFAIMD